MALCRAFWRRFSTAICSSYYHLAPDNARLVWDRLPMTVGFMGLLAALVSERVDRSAGRTLLVPLLIAGVALVLYWDWTEVRGAGDLRPYFLVQFGSLLLVALILLLYPSSGSDTRYIVGGLLVYVLAKIFEVADAEIFAIGGMVSGHTLKHLVAAAGVWCLVLMVRARAMDLRSARRLPQSDLAGDWTVPARFVVPTVRFTDRLLTLTPPIREAFPHRVA